MGYYQMLMRTSTQTRDLCDPSAVLFQAGQLCAGAGSLQSHRHQQASWRLYQSACPNSPSQPRSPRLLPVLLCPPLCSPSIYLSLAGASSPSPAWALGLTHSIPPAEHHPVGKLESKPGLITHLETRCYATYWIPRWMTTGNTVCCLHT